MPVFAQNGYVTTKQVLYLLKKDMLVWDHSGPAETGTGYEERIDYAFYISCGVEVENVSSQEVKKMIVCQFLDKWGHVLASPSQRVTLQPGEKRRLVFNSDMMAENFTGNYYADGLSSINPKILTDLEEKAFITFNYDLPFDNKLKLNVTVNHTLTEIKCNVIVN